MIYTAKTRIYSLGSFDVPKGGKIKVNEVQVYEERVVCETYEVGKSHTTFWIPISILNTFFVREMTEEEIRDLHRRQKEI